MNSKIGAINRKVELISGSSKRMENGLMIPDQVLSLRFMKRESWLHLRRSLELFLLLITI